MYFYIICSTLKNLLTEFLGFLAAHGDAGRCFREIIIFAQRHRVRVQARHLSEKTLQGDEKHRAENFMQSVQTFSYMLFLVIL